MNEPGLCVIAEAALSYHGSLELAKLLVKSACVGLADAIKFQIMYSEDICVKPYKHYDLFQSMELSLDDWRCVKEYAHKHNLKFIADVFGEKSLNIAKSIEVDAVKIHTTIFNEVPLIEKIFNLDKKIYLSTGGLTISEVQMFCEKYTQINKNVCLLHGYQAEPTELSNNYLNQIPRLRDMTSLEVGFMDHIEGNSEYNCALSHVALGLGVRTFEKHIAISREFMFENYISSINPDVFKFYSKSLRKLYTALGDTYNKQDILSEEEQSYRKKAMKKVVSARDINAGQTICYEDLCYKRTDEESSKTYYNASEVVQRKTSSFIPKNTLISEELIDEK